MPQSPHSHLLTRRIPTPNRALTTLTLASLVHFAHRRDFSDFRSGDMAKRSSGQVSGGKHIGSKTIVYAVPPGGWNDDTTPMRKSLGGMRAAMSSGLEKVEDETRRVAGDVIYGYKVKGDMIRNQKGMKGLLKATVNTDQETGNTSQASLDLEGVADQQLYRDLQNSEGELKGMLELRKNTSRKLAVSKAVWEKGGSLPPRLYSEHDFRIMAGECDLANPDAPAKVASFSVFEQDYRYITYTHNLMYIVYVVTNTCTLFHVQRSAAFGSVQEVGQRAD